MKEQKPQKPKTPPIPDDGSVHTSERSEDRAKKRPM